MILPAKKFTHLPVETPVVLLEEGKIRRYVLPDGRKYPSVTTVLSELPNEGIEKWKKRKGATKARAIAKAAALRGERLHAALKMYLKNQVPTYATPFTQSLFDKVQPVLNRHVDNIRLIEEPIYSDQLFMAGTPDLIAEWNGELAVIDFKTTHIQKQDKWIERYYCQVGAYGVMFNELFQEKIHKGVLIIVSDDDDFEEPQIFEKPASECFKMLDGYAAKLIKHRESEQANAVVTVH